MSLRPTAGGVSLDMGDRPKAAPLGDKVKKRRRGGGTMLIVIALAVALTAALCWMVYSAVKAGGQWIFASKLGGHHKVSHLEWL